MPHEYSLADAQPYTCTQDELPNLSNMPADVLGRILSYLDGSDRRRLYSVSRELRSIVGGLLTGNVVINLRKPGKYSVCVCVSVFLFSYK